jgi:hypothetical protein
MNIVHDLLDKQLVNRNRHRIGRVDGIIVELRPGAAPRIVAIEVGAVTLARRISRKLAAWIERARERWSPARGRSYRIPISALRELGVDVTIDLDAREAPSYAWESWLRRHIIDKMP